MKPFLAIALLLSAAACISPASDQTEKKNEAAYILISKDNKGQIGEWLHILDPELQIVEFYGIPLDSLEFYLDRAQAVVIDVFPDDLLRPGEVAPHFGHLPGPTDDQRGLWRYAHTGHPQLYRKTPGA